jgi:uncharacterized membrane protein
MRNRWLAPAVTLAMWAFALAVFGRLPAMVPSHVNLAGEVDGWLPRAYGAFLPAIIATGMVGLIHLVPRIDPRASNVEKFQGDWRLLLNLIVLFFAVVEATTLGHALGWPVDLGQSSLVSVALLFVGIGNYLPRVRSNWFMGIRTPWTMDNERVWRATHRVGGRTFVAAGLMLGIAALLPAGARPALTLVSIAVAVVIPLVYSYVAWRRDVAGRPL